MRRFASFREPFPVSPEENAPLVPASRKLRRDECVLQNCRQWRFSAPSPHCLRDFRGGGGCGERAGVRGLERCGPLTPTLSPTVESSLNAVPIVGERGQNRTAAYFCDAHTRDERQTSGSCLSSLVSSYDSSLRSLTRGRNSAMTMNPTMMPRTTVMIGSSKFTKPSIRTVTSSSYTSATL